MQLHEFRSSDDSFTLPPTHMKRAEISCYGSSCRVLLLFALRRLSPGDAENDVEMLRLAGVGVCVGNASLPAKAAARFMAPTNAEDGSAIAMEQLLRSKRPGSAEE